MKTILKERHFEHDPNLTRQCYQKIVSNYACTCAPCRNFMVMLDRAFPAAFRALADTLAIDLHKATEIYHLEREPSGLHLMGGWFHFVGSIPDEEVGGQIHTIRQEEYNQDFQFYFTSHLALIRPSFEGHPLVQLEFYTRVPWNIPDEEEK